MATTLHDYNRNEYRSGMREYHVYKDQNGMEFPLRSPRDFECAMRDLKQREASVEMREKQLEEYTAPPKKQTSTAVPLNSLLLLLEM